MTVSHFFCNNERFPFTIQLVNSFVRSITPAKQNGNLVVLDFHDACLLLNTIEYFDKIHNFGVNKYDLCYNCEG